MKKILNTKLFYFFLGAVIFSSASVFAYSLISSNIGFTPKDTSWNVENVKDALDDLNKKVNCDESMINKTWEYNYSGQEVIFVSPCKGTYKLEVWGAQGGNANNVAIGGYGGYSVGNTQLKRLQELYVYIGGAGVSSTSKTADYNGGYNGGGKSYHWGNNDCITGSGGGATHISKTRSLLSQLGNQKDKILIVAGGGGGAGYYNNSVYANGGSGGGITGVDGNPSPNGDGYYGLGGTQTAGGLYVRSSTSFSRVKPQQGSFGKGADSSTTISGAGGTSTGSGGAGGGSGYYGGGSAVVQSSAGGGSGYIGNSQLTNKKMVVYTTNTKYVSNVEETKTEITTNVSDSPISDNAKKGNGYAKITLIGIN